MKVFPAIVMLPLRPAVAVLAATEKITVPLPDPLAPAVTVIHPVPLTAVQPQPVPLLTVTEPVPLAAATDALPGEMVYTQAAAAWETVKVCPAIVILPLRVVVPVLAATE